MGKKLPKRGVPAYMLTLADMWSLLLIFFIMLFAMSQVDATKFKEVKGTLKTTFGFNQQTIFYGPPPGVSLIESKASSDNAGTDIIFDQPANNSIIDPQLAALKMQACERQVKKDASDIIASKKNAVLIRKVLASEIKSGLFAISEYGKEVSLMFPVARAFEGSQLTQEMRRGLIKVGYAFGSSNGAVVIRNYVPNSYSSKFKSAYNESTARTSIVAAALMESEKIAPDRLQMGSMSSTRAPAAVKAFPESSIAPFFEVVVIKD
jgi:chemotaxis protein MotB